MEQPRQAEFTADEFIAWALEQPEGRFELDNGVVVAMAPERVNHGRAKNRTLRALETAIAARGLGCSIACPRSWRLPILPSPSALRDT
jgi:Uma2 family endonuclease